MIFRTLDIIVVAAMLGTAAWTFKVKHDSEQALERVAALQDEIRRERETIDLLRADWSLLTSPDRLEMLVERHGEELKLNQAEPRQFVTIDDIPARPAEVLAPEDVPEHALKTGLDRQTITGTVTPGGLTSPQDRGGM